MFPRWPTCLRQTERERCSTETGRPPTKPRHICTKKMHGIIINQVTATATGDRSRATKVGPRPCRHHEVLSEWGFRQPNPPTPKIIFSSDFGHLVLKMLKIKIFIRVLFTWIVQFSFRSFVDSVCSARSCVFSHFNVDTTYVQVLVILRPTKRI